EPLWLCGDLMYSRKPFATAFAMSSAWPAVRPCALIWRIPVAGFFTTTAVARSVFEIGGVMCGRAKVSTGSLPGTTARGTEVVEGDGVVRGVRAGNPDQRGADQIGRLEHRIGGAACQSEKRRDQHDHPVPPDDPHGPFQVQRLLAHPASRLPAGVPRTMPSD